MKLINLLPEDVQLRPARRRVVMGGVVIGLFFLILVGAGWFFLNTQVGHRKEQLAAAELQSQQATGEKVETPPDIADLSARVNQLNTLSATELDWARIFTTSSSIVAKDVRLNSLSFAGTASAFVVSMSGEAPTNVSFASFVETLRSYQGLTEVKVDNFTYLPSKSTVTFSISCKVASTLITYPAT